MNPTQTSTNLMIAVGQLAVIITATLVAALAERIWQNAGRHYPELAQPATIWVTEALAHGWIGWMTLPLLWLITVSVCARRAQSSAWTALALRIFGMVILFAFATGVVVGGLIPLFEGLSVLGVGRPGGVNS